MILVTGGTGMVGMHLLLELTREHKLVRAIYRTKEKVREVEDFFAFAKAAPQLSHIEWLQADITDIPSLEQAFFGVTHVYHCAGLISFNPYDYRKLKKVNTEGTANVVNLSLSHKVQKICHLSSIATLAKTPHNPITEENYWNPDAENSVYAISKYGAEMEVWRATQEGLPAIILNPGIILGEGDYNSGSGMLFKRVNNGFNYFTTGGTGIIDVKDLVQAMISGMNKPLVNQRYIAVTHNVSYKELLTAVAVSLGNKAPKRKVSQLGMQVFRFFDFVRGWFTKHRQLTLIGIKSLQDISEYNNHKAVEQLELNVLPLNDTLDRISQHFLHRKSTEGL